MGSPFALKRGRIGTNGDLNSTNASSPDLPADVPSVATLKTKAQKYGFLKKLSGRGILTSGTWRRRFCVLVKSRLYYFENEESSGKEKSAGFINLEYFDCCSETSSRTSRKVENVFVIGCMDKGFFETHLGRHYFATDNGMERTEWVTAINLAISKTQPKDKKSYLGSPQLFLLKPGKENRRSKAVSVQPQIEDISETVPRSSERLDCAVTKARVRGPHGRRLPRKSHIELPASVKKTQDVIVEKVRVHSDPVQVGIDDVRPVEKEDDESKPKTESSKERTKISLEIEEIAEEKEKEIEEEEEENNSCLSTSSSTKRLDEKTGASGEPGKPDGSGEPDKPGESSNLDKPHESGKPEKPHESGKPDKPHESCEPNKSSESGKPKKLSESGEPDTLGESGEPSKSGGSDEPGKSGEPGKPSEAGKLVESDKPGKSGDPDPAPETPDVKKNDLMDESDSDRDDLNDFSMGFDNAWFLSSPVSSPIDNNNQSNSTPTTNSRRKSRKSICHII